MKPELVANANAGSVTDDRRGRDPADPPPLDAMDQPPADRYCDVVLTGGVTDGVVYPWAVLELARKYRFANIGGTSVGAMAAALTAAAEYGRRYGSVTGFNQVLRKLPRKLGEDIGGTTRLFSLFQPAPSTRRLFELFVGFLGTDSAANEQAAPRRTCGVCASVREHVLVRRARRVCRYVMAVLRPYSRPASAGALLGLLVVWAISLFWHAGSLLALVVEVLFAGLPCALVAGILFVAFALYRDLVCGFVQENRFGLCTGYRNETTPPGQQSLIEWLHEGIQGACGKPLDRPLTFKDLWDAPGGPDGRPLPPTRRTRKSRSIDLRMVTTNLTHGRPYALPFDDETSRLFFKRKDLEPYFPDTVLDYLVDHSERYVCKAPGEDPDPRNVKPDFFELPAADLPLVVAARLSLSFPVLFSAVPLWAIDYEPPLEDRTLRKCWFSDGGICSNFPIHLFDAALPQWPTFGIALGPRSVFWGQERIWLPEYYNNGRGDRWDRFGDENSALTGEPVPLLDRLLGFVLSIVWSAKDWNDKTSMRMPGVRDRVVRVALKQGEGGLNLKLTRRQILKLASDYGLPAGKALVDKFVDPVTDQRPSTPWNEHRWVRFNSLLAGLRERIEALGAAAELSGYATPLSAQIAEAEQAPPLREADKAKERRLTPEQARALQDLLAALKDLESRFAQAEIRQPYTPLPTPSIRVRPPL